MRAICLAIVVFLPSVTYCQDTISVDAVASMQVCGPKNPPSAGPCATAPKPLSKANPAYPEKARRNRKEGTVELGLTVSKDGSVSGVHVLKGVDKDIDQAAVAAVNQWRFDPGTYQGNPVDVELSVTINFRLAPDASPTRLEDLTQKSAASNDTRNLYSDGSEAYNRGDYATAANLFRRIISDSPQNASAWVELGRALLAMDQFDGAADAFQTSIKIDPGTRYAYNNLGLVYWRQRKLEDAAVQFRRQILVNPDDHYAHRNLGMMLRDQHKCNDAMPELQKALALTPNHAETLVAKGDCDLELGNRANGMSELEQATSISSAPNIFNSAAWVLANRNIDLETAEKWSDACLTIEKARLQEVPLENVSPEQLNYVFWISAYWDTRGWIYFLRGDIGKAQPYVEASWSLRAEPTVGDHLGQIYEQLGRADDATKIYAMAVASAEQVTRARLDPDDLADAKQRLIKLVGEKKMDSRISRGRADLAAKDLMSIANPDAVSTTVDFAVRIATGKPPEFHALNGGDAMGAKFIPALQSANLPITIPASSGVELPLRGTLTCHTEESQCRFAFVNAEEAVNISRTELANATPVPIPIHDPHIYDNPAIGVRVVLPDEWKVVHEEPGSFSRPRNAIFAKPGSLAMFMLTRERFDGSMELYQKSLENFFSKKTDFQRTGTEAVKRDGFAGTRWIVTWNEKSIPYSSVMEIFSVGEDYYRVTTVAPKEIYSRYAETFENVLHSVQFPMEHVNPQLLDTPK